VTRDDPAREAGVEEAAAALAPHLPPALVPVFSAAFIRSTVLYDEFVYRLALQVAREIGLEAAARQPGTPDELAARAGLAPAHARVALDWLARELVGRRHLEAVGEAPRRFRAVGPLPALDPAPVLEAQRRHDPSCLPSYALAEAAARHYPPFLRGEVAGDDIVAAPGRFRLWVDYFSGDNALYAVNNRVGAVAAEAWLPPGPATILELGGGLGSGAAALLDRLAETGRLADVEEYRFTELVPVFLRRGQRLLEGRAGGGPVLTFGALDMNQPFAAQGVAPGGATLVYAVNTLHVAHDLDATLAEVFRALAPGGQLVLSECVRLLPGQPVYVEFVFNLLETFRSPRLHPAHRPTGGFLTPEQWTRALEAAGFQDVRCLPDVVRLRERFPDFFTTAIGATRPR
jgi:SAM-dependent methyltransferase